MKPSLIAQDEVYERAVTSDTDYVLLLAHLVKLRRQLFVCGMLMGLISLYVLVRDVPHMRYSGDIPSSFVLGAAAMMFFCALHFTTDVSIKLLKAIKAARK